MSRVPLAGLALGLTLALGAPTLPAAAGPGPGSARAAGGGSVALDGHGYGHGRGLSQYGAQRAAKRGRTHREILRFYYPRTRVGRVGGTIRIHLSGDTRNDLVVRDRDGLTVRSLGAKRTWRLRERRARTWRITPTDGGSRSKVSWRAGGRWRTWRTVPGEAEFAAGGAPVRLLGPAPASYRGTLRSARNETGRVTVNVLPLEQYLRGVVPLEVPALWKPAAVRAQAVAARTYAAFERRTNTRPAYDLCDTARCQVYGGASAEHPASDAAVRRTARQAVVKRGKPVFAQFNASSGGWTVDGGRPYLVAKRDPWDDWAGNPYHDWSTSLTAEEIEQQWPALGTLEDVTVDERDGNGQWGGRVLEMTLHGSAADVPVEGDTFQGRFGLRSTWFDLTTDL